MSRLQRANRVPMLVVLCGTLAAAQVTFTTINVPGAAATVVLGINSAGEMVGGYYQAQYLWHGFKLSGTTLTYFDYPGAQWTIPTGINNEGLIVGDYSPDSISVHGFTYDGQIFTSIQHGSDSITNVSGINNAGQIYGGTGNPEAKAGFVLTNGRFSLIEPPGKQNYTYAYVDGVGVGNIVGTIVLVTSDYAGFRYSGGKFTQLNYPGAASTYVFGENGRGIAVGGYSSVHYGPESGFVTKSGKFAVLNYPNATWTECDGINDSGQIVGLYIDAKGVTHGYVTSPIKQQDFKDK